MICALTLPAFACQSVEQLTADSQRSASNECSECPSDFIRLLQHWQRINEFTDAARGEQLLNNLWSSLGNDQDTRALSPEALVARLNRFSTELSSMGDENLELLFGRYDSTDLRFAFAMNFLSTIYQKRKNRKPYYQHPSRMVAFLLPYIQPIRQDAIYRTLTLIQLHDVIEEGLRTVEANPEATNLPFERLVRFQADFYAHSQPNTLVNQRILIDFINHITWERDQALKGLGTAVTTVMSPYLNYDDLVKRLFPTASSCADAAMGTDTNDLKIRNYVARKAMGAYVAKRSGDLASILVEIADRLDWFFDLDYLVNKHGQPNTTKKSYEELVRGFARTLWTLEYLVSGGEVQAKAFPSTMPIDPRFQPIRNLIDDSYEVVRALAFSSDSGSDVVQIRTQHRKSLEQFEQDITRVKAMFIQVGQQHGLLQTVMEDYDHALAQAAELN